MLYYYTYPICKTIFIMKGYGTVYTPLLATLRPEHGQICEMAGYVNHHVNSIYAAAMKFKGCA